MLAPDKTGKLATLGIVGVAGAGLWARTVQGVVSFVPNLLPSRTPKEASAAAAILAGIGLLALPMEQTQAQSAVPEVILQDWDIMTSDEFEMEVVNSSGSEDWLDVKYCWSGIYKVPLDEDERGWKWINAEDYSYLDDAEKGYHSSNPWQYDYYFPAFRYDYYICKMVLYNPKTKNYDTSLGWVEVWFFTGEYYTNGDYEPPSAFVSDSDVNFYEVDITIE